MPTSPTSGPGGGGGSGLPSQWSADSHGSVIAEVDDPNEPILTIQGIPLQGDALLQVDSDSGTHGIKIVGDGVDDIDSTTFQNVSGSILSMGSDGKLTAEANGELSLEGNGFASLTAPRLVFVGMLAAPADGDLAAGHFALWLDATNGVGNTKLMVKAKSADGTVKTAAVVLA